MSAPSIATDEAALASELRRAEEALANKRPGEAAGICQDMLSRQRDHPPALALLGRVLGEQGQLQRGLAFVERAAASDPTSSHYQHMLCGFYRLLHRTDEAIDAVRRAVALDPAKPGLSLDLGKCLMDRGDWEEGISAFLTCLVGDPQNPEAHLAMGQILLGRGEMRPGWAEYEWRNKLPMAKNMVPTMRAPAWNGMAMPDRRLLLIGDQGFGDTLQFSRYIPMAAERCGEVVLACVPDLLKLMTRVKGLSRVESRWDSLPPHACHVLLSSLPLIFDTQLETIPPPCSDIVADASEVERWRATIDEAADSGRLKVGLVWAGRPVHPNDRRRSMRLSDLSPLGEVEGVSFLALQKPWPKRDKPETFPGLVDLSNKLSDFSETAAALMNLDLVITVDTAVAHLAGTLGVKTFLMLPRPSDWRWMHEGAQTPWYPSLRLFRQARPGDWTGVVAEVSAALRSQTASTEATNQSNARKKPRRVNETRL